MLSIHLQVAVGRDSDPYWEIHHPVHCFVQVSDFPPSPLDLSLFYCVSLSLGTGFYMDSTSASTSRVSGAPPEVLDEIQKLFNSNRLQ